MDFKFLKQKWKWKFFNLQHYFIQKYLPAVWRWKCFIFCVKSMLQIYRKIVNKSAFGADFTLFYSFCENKFYIIQNALYIKSLKAKFIAIIHVKTHCICRCGFILLHPIRHVDIPYIFLYISNKISFYYLLHTI